MNFGRKLLLSQAAAKKSLLLLGPRQTGKTTLLKAAFPNARFYNLLHTDVFFRLYAQPSLLREELRTLSPTERSQPVIIDEIQKLPVLLDEVQAIIDEQGLRFVLTGSSARKLKAGGANLLGGRARIRHLYPFVSAELPDFKLEKALRWGLLPPIWFSDDPHEDLQAYAGTYLREEIHAEALVRKLDAFTRFLSVAGLTSGQELNYEALARDGAVPARTVREYVSVLEDTLIAEALPPWRHGSKRKPVSSIKLYFFDLAVARTLAGRRPPEIDSSEWGQALEQFIFQELRAWLSYRHDDRPLTYWRTVDQREVDFVIGDELAIEVKSSTRLRDADLKGLRAISEESTLNSRIVICREATARQTDDGILILPVEEFLSRLWETGF